MKLSTTVKLFAVPVLLLTLSGCAVTEPEPTATPTPTNTQTQAEIEEEFYKIAADSCAKGQQEGLVE